MSENEYLLISSAFRFCFFSVNCHGVILFVQNAMLGRKRSLKTILLYLSLKVVFVNTFLGFFLKDLHWDIYRNHEWLQILYVVCLIVTSVLSYFISIYTFKGEPIRVAMVAWMSELVGAFIGYFSIVFINIVEGRTVLSFMGEFQMLDLGIPVICCGLLGILYFLCQPLLKRFKTYKIKHEKILWLLFFIYISGVTYPMIWEYTENVGISIFIILFIVGMLLPILYFTLKKYQNKLEEERGFLKAQQKCMKSHYQKILEEVQYLEICRKETEGEVRELRDFQEGEGRQERIADYKESLIQEYQKLKTGMFCDDWVLDAALSSQAELLDRYGIRMESSMQEYHKGTVSQQDILQIIFHLIHWGVRANTVIEDPQNKWVSLQMSSIKGQLLILFTSSWNGKERISEKTLQRYIQKYDGTFKIQKTENTVQIIIVL